MIRIHPSSNPPKEEFLVDFARELESYGINFMHFDVMDGEFVDNLCLTPQVIENVLQNSRIGADIHLMVKDPISQLKEYLKLGANYITVHYESFKDIVELITAIKMIKSKGILAGVSIKPNTPISSIAHILPFIDLLLIMSVEPGKSGQEFMLSALNKIREARAIIRRNRLRVKIEVDGGINPINAPEIIRAGANLLVMGNAFYFADNRVELIKKILAYSSLYEED